MIRAISPQPVWFTPESEKGENPPGFLIRPPTAFESLELDRALLESNPGVGGGVPPDRLRMPMGAVKALVCACVQDWRNIKNAAGENVAFGRADPEASLGMLPAAVISDLFVEVSRLRALSEEEKKK